MMKYLIIAVVLLFIIFMAVGFYEADLHYEGLVEERYSEKAEHYFEELAKEHTIGFEMKISDSLNPFEVILNTKEGPLKGAKVILRVGRIDTPADMKFRLKEISPGHYITNVRIPQRGYYMFNLEISSSIINTTKRWFKML